MFKLLMTAPLHCGICKHRQRLNMNAQAIHVGKNWNQIITIFVVNYIIVLSLLWMFYSNIEIIDEFLIEQFTWVFKFINCMISLNAIRLIVIHANQFGNQFCIPNYLFTTPIWNKMNIEWYHQIIIMLCSLENYLIAICITYTNIFPVSSVVEWKKIHLDIPLLFQLETLQIKINSYYECE